MFRTRWLFHAVDVLLLAGISLYILAGVAAVPFHGDESTLIWMSDDYYTLVYGGDSSTITFQQPPVHAHRQHERVMTGAIGPFLMGLAGDLTGFGPDDLNEPWRWHYADEEYWERNQADGAIPSPDLLFAARLPSAILTALSVFLVLIIARLATDSPVAGWFAALFYGLNPAVLLNGRRAMQEGATFFFTALVILIALLLARRLADARTTRRQILGWLLALGAAGGAAMASKHTTAAAFAVALLAIWIVPLLGKRLEGVPEGVPFDWPHTAGVIGAGILGGLVFMLLTPALWLWPHMLVLGSFALIGFTLSLRVSGLRRWLALGLAAFLIFVAFDSAPRVFAELVELPLYMAKKRMTLMTTQVQLFGGTEYPQRLTVLFKQALTAGPQYFEDPHWATIPTIQQQIAAYEGAGLAGWGGLVRGMLVAGLGLVGLFTLPRRTPEGALLVILWLLGGVAAMLVNPLPWQRYYVILHAPLAVLAGGGIAVLVALGTQMMRRPNRVTAI
ncbi:MAG: hypothetical protein Kow0077_27390 [Anaerolineae bacterium]